MMEYLRFGELYAIPSSNGLSRPSAVRGAGYKMVNMGELFSNGIINDIPMERVQMSDKELSKFLLEKGDLLFARQSLVAEGAGKCSYVNDLTEETTFESHLIRVRLNPKRAISKYFYYLFQLPNNPIKTIVNQGAQAGIRGSELIRVKVPCPSIKVQKKIASILSAYDSQIENNQKRIKILEQMAENLYKEWFVRFRFPGFENTEFEGGVPKGWKVVKVKECVDRLRFGTLYGKDSVESDGDVIVIDQSQEPYIGFHNNAPSHIADTQKPIILFGDHSCKFELMIIPFSLAENVVPFVAKSGIDTTFLYFTTHNLIQTTEYKRHWTEFVNKKILLPPANLQREYAKKVIDILSMKQQLIVENRLLSKQRDLLLPRLMSGKLSI